MKENNINESTSAKDCAQVLITWSMLECTNPTKIFRFQNDETEERAFTTNVLIKKLKAFDIDIKIPDPLFILIAVCVNDNPGMCQIMLKMILENICNIRGSKIPKGYVITSEDFVDAFPNDFPLMYEYKEMEELFLQKYMEQKDKSLMDTPLHSDNLMDTKEWWYEVYDISTNT